MKRTVTLPLTVAPDRVARGSTRKETPLFRDQTRVYSDEHTVQACFARVREYLRMSSSLRAAPYAPSADSFYRDLDELHLPKGGAERRRRRNLIARLDLLLDIEPVQGGEGSGRTNRRGPSPAPAGTLITSQKDDPSPG